jgi:hypothetical protein
MRKMPLRSTLGRGAPATGLKLEYIRNVAASWAKTKPPTRAAIIHALPGDRRSGRGVRERSPHASEAYAHGLALALPEEVVVPPFRPGAGHGADQIGRWRARQELSVLMPYISGSQSPRLGKGGGLARAPDPKANALSAELQA